MRGALGLISLLLALAVVGLLVKKQMASTTVAVPGVPTTAAGTPAAVQSQQVQQQVKQAMEAAMQQPRPMPDEK